MPEYVGLLGRSFLLGLAIAAPVGPTSMTAIRRGLATGAWAAFWVGMGAALTDFFYIVATYAGFTPLFDRIPGLKTVLYLAGAIVLARIAYGAIKDALTGAGAPVIDAEGVSNIVREPWTALLALGVGVTLINPATITYWVSVGGAFVASSLSGRSVAGAGGMMLAVWAGSAFWFTVLAGIVGVARARIEQLPWLFRAVGCISGFILLAFAIAFAIRGIERVA
ncbi:MAG TPA: LysE family transporter [Thermomicrobiales bacterium]|nr:LysE family transporter [Thermomicrobiales bacterium]